MEPTKLLQIGSAELSQKSRDVILPINSDVVALINNLKSLLAPNKLIGLSAPQVGQNKNVFVTNVREPQTTGPDSQVFRVFINPQIIESSSESIESYEGCGSVLQNGIFGPVMRPKQITIEAFNENNQKFRITADGILARVIQHEYDHLQGILFLEKVSDYKKLMDLEHYIAFAKGSKEQKASYIMTVFEYQLLT